MSDLSLGALDDLASSSGSRTLHRGRGHRQRRRRQADQVFLHRAPEEHFPAQELILAGAKSLPPKALGADVAGRSFKPRGTIRDIFGGNEKGSGACSCYEGNVHE